MPSLNTPPRSSPYWAGGVFADPGEFGAVQDAFGGYGMTLNWLFPLAVGGVTADQAQGLYDDLNQATTAIPALTGGFQAAAGTITVTSPLTADLAAFLATQSAMETVLLLLFVSLTVTGAAVIALAGRMVVARPGRRARHAAGQGRVGTAARRGDRARRADRGPARRAVPAPAWPSPWSPAEPRSRRSGGGWPAPWSRPRWPARR